MTLPPVAGLCSQELPSPESLQSSPAGISPPSSTVHIHQEINNESVEINPADIVETEVVGFSLKGPQAWHKLTLYDMGAAVTSDGRRFLSLLQFLKAMGIEYEIEKGVVSFSIYGGPKLFLDMNSKLFGEEGELAPTELIVGVSDITMKPDVFLAPTIIESLFPITIQWDDAGYGFEASTDQALPIWKRPEGKSLFAIKTEEIISTLPEILPPAELLKTNFNMDFVELKGRLKARPVNKSDKKEASLGSLEQNFWGSLIQGRYKFRFTEPQFTLREDESLDTGQPPIFRMNWGEWEYSFNNGTVVAGDSIFGLNDLAFPSLRFSGIRSSAVFQNGAEMDWRESSGGANFIFQRPHVVEEFVPVGSTVELFVNDQLIDTDLVVSSLPSLPGTGVYRFSDVRLASGSLNQIRLKIIDPNGVETTLEKNILGNSIMMQPGSMALFAGMGTNRKSQDWSNHGLFTGGRILYGVNSDLTAGLSMAWQNNFFEPMSLFQTNDTESRQYPDSSLHVGAQFAWQPIDWSMFTGEAFWVQTEHNDDSNSGSDLAFKTVFKLYPGKNLHFDSLYFRIGPDYFDGRLRDLKDRQGYVVNGSYRYSSKWMVRGAFGQVWDNLDRNATETLSVNLYNASVSTSIIPKTTLSLGVNRLVPNWLLEKKELFTVEFQTRPGFKLTGKGSYSWGGDDLSLEGHTDFLDGIRLPGFSLSRSRHTSFSLSRPTNNYGNWSLHYWKAGIRERFSLNHSMVHFLSEQLQVNTELGYDYDKRQMFFENRLEYPLGRSGRSRLGFRARYEAEEWRVELFVNMLKLFNFGEGGVRDVTERRVNPEQGIVFGRVFVDNNANAILDPDEKGLPGIKVFLDSKFSMESGRDGYFIFQTYSLVKTATIHLDPDTVPAVYHILNGRQTVNFGSGKRSKRARAKVNLAITPVHAIAGYVKMRLIDKDSDETTPVPGVRVYITRMITSQTIITESTTAGDGSYYLQNILPGKYIINLDKATLPNIFDVPDANKVIEIFPSAEPQEIEPDNFLIIRGNKEI